MLNWIQTFLRRRASRRLFESYVSISDIDAETVSVLKAGAGVPGPVQPPIIVVERGDVSAFESVDDARRWMEAVDVRNGAYAAYDSQGYLLRLWASEPVVMVIGREPGLSAVETLDRALRAFMDATGEDSSAVADLTHDALLALFISRFGYSR